MISLSTGAALFIIIGLVLAGLSYAKIVKYMARFSTEED